MSIRRWDDEAIAEHIKKIVATFPPLTNEQRALLAALFSTAPAPSAEDGGDRELVS